MKRVRRTLRNTTLYLRKIPAMLVRELTARAAHEGVSLTALVTDALTRAVGPESRDELEPLEADMTWYEAHRRQLLRQYRDEYLAIVDRRVFDHDPDFSALAARVFAKVGVRPIFMPQCVETDQTVHLRSPRVIRA